MSPVTLTFALAFYFAGAVLIVGLAFKIRQFLITPVPLKIPLMPAPLTQKGAFFRMAREVFYFESLFKSNKWIWIFAVLFHVGLLLVLLRHLRYFIEPVWFWVVLVQPFGIYAGYVMLVGLVGLWARRFLVSRIRYISSLSDHLMLTLLVMIGLSGLTMKYVAPTDIIAVKAFFLGLLRFDIQPLPTEPSLLLHLGLVVALMIIFPFSKLLHVPGIFFSPSLNQTDDAREKRYLPPLSAKLDKQGGNI